MSLYYHIILTISTISSIDIVIHTCYNELRQLKRKELKMSKENKAEKMKALTKEDLKIIENDASLSDYIVNSKLRESRKTMIIFTIIFVFFAFVGGVVVGLNLAKTATPNNVVQVQVSTDKTPEKQ